VVPLEAMAVELAHAVAGLGYRRLRLVYVDHQLRPDSPQDGARVRALAGALGADAAVIPVCVDREVASLEAAAREARYAALDALDADAIVTGHTASDQAETVLMRIVRGTGVAGLAGIPRRRGRYVRPLLDVTRDEVLAYLREHRLKAVQDPMNDDPALTRNRIRGYWLPALREENPAIDAALVRLAHAAAEQRDLLEWAASQLAERAARDGALDARVLATAPPAAVKRVLQRVAEAAGLEPLAARHLDALLRLVQRPTAGTIEIALPGATARREYDRVQLGWGMLAPGG